MEYGMEFECLFGVSDGIQDITRRSGMVRRIRFIYRKSFSRFENDPVFFWKVLEVSRRVRKKSPWKVESGTPPTLAGQPKGGGVPGGLLPMVAGHPTKGKGGVPLHLGLAIWKVLELGSYSKILT